MASWRLRHAIATVHRAARITDGRFDAAVLDDLERLGEHGATLAGPARSRAAFSRWSDQRLGEPRERPRKVRVPDRPLDSGGIGKGLALRWAAARAVAALGGEGSGSGLLLDAGGDVVAVGQPPFGGWRVGIEDPVRGITGAEPLAVIAMTGGAVATSSISERRWTDPDGVRVHHLVDPRTGEPARTGLLAVTVAGSDPAWSEVWTKALFLAGRDAIGGEARRRGLAAWWVDAAGHLGMTPEARLRSVWVADSRIG